MKINYSQLKSPSKGIVYILYLDIEYEGKVHKVTKIGVTTRNVEDRVTEILTSIWKITRIFPRCYVKRFKTINDPYTIEATLLGIFTDRFDIGLKFSGSTECFVLDDEFRESLLKSYESLTNDTNKKE